MQSLTTPHAGVINANLMAMCSMMAWAVGLPAAEPLIARLPELDLAGLENLYQQLASNPELPIIQR